jgi:hypothetical protein
VHEAHVAEVGIVGRIFAVAQSVVAGTLAVPAGFVVEEAEEPVGIGADVQTEGPNAATGLDAVGVLDVVVSIVGVTYTEIGLDGVLMLQILQGLAGEHADVTHVGVAGHSPQGAVRIPVHGGGAILVNVVTTQEGTGGFSGDLNFQCHRFSSVFRFSDYTPNGRKCQDLQEQKRFTFSKSKNIITKNAAMNQGNAPMVTY